MAKKRKKKKRFNLPRAPIMRQRNQFFKSGKDYSRQKTKLETKKEISGTN